MADDESVIRGIQVYKLTSDHFNKYNNNKYRLVYALSGKIRRLDWFKAEVELTKLVDIIYDLTTG